ncbi:hypothetical protein DRP04_11995 [Archaeoglobales archaeon]|nr:MAG: hypothetical protein DRP04_11995 [Archaeoglobales archaeon]
MDILAAIFMYLYIGFLVGLALTLPLLATSRITKSDGLFLMILYTVFWLPLLIFAIINHIKEHRS